MASHEGTRNEAGEKCRPLQAECDHVAPGVYRTPNGMFAFAPSRLLEAARKDGATESDVASLADFLTRVVQQAMDEEGTPRIAR